MTPMQQLLIALWMLSFTDGVAAALAARQAFRLRAIADNRTIFEWLTALGVGLGLYSLEVFVSVFNGITAGPTATAYSTRFILTALVFRLIRTIGMWLITLTLLNGGAPGILRRGVWWTLGKFGMMDRKVRSSPAELKIDKLTASVKELHVNAENVAEDLAVSRENADKVIGEAGEAADAAAKSPVKT